MAKTLKKMTWSVIEQLSNFEVNDDNEYDPRLIEDIIVSIHPTFVRQYHNERRLDQSKMQMHLNVPVEPLNGSFEYNGITFTPKVSVCIAEIPEVVNGIGWSDIGFLGSSDLQDNFIRKSVAAFFARNGRVLFRLPKPQYCIVGNKVLIKGQIKFISLIGYFIDPRRVNTYDPEEPFPTMSEYKLEMLALQQILSTKNIPYDIKDDGQRLIVAPRAVRTGTNTQNRQNVEQSS